MKHLIYKIALSCFQAILIPGLVGCEENEVSYQPLENEMTQVMLDYQAGKNESTRSSFNHIVVTRGCKPIEKELYGKMQFIINEGERILEQIDSSGITFEEYKRFLIRINDNSKRKQVIPPKAFDTSDNNLMKLKTTRSVREAIGEIAMQVTYCGWGFEIVQPFVAVREISKDSLQIKACLYGSKLYDERFEIDTSSGMKWNGDTLFLSKDHWENLQEIKGNLCIQTSCDTWSKQPFVIRDWYDWSTVLK